MFHRGVPLGQQASGAGALLVRQLPSSRYSPQSLFLEL